MSENRNLEIYQEIKAILEEIWQDRNVRPSALGGWYAGVDQALAERICDALGREFPGLQDDAITCDDEIAHAEMVAAGARSTRTLFVIIGPRGRTPVEVDMSRGAHDLPDGMTVEDSIARVPFPLHKRW